MSKSSEFDKTVKNYILDRIDNDGYSDKELVSNEDKIKFLKNTFYAEYGWMVERSGECKALSEWYQGLPSAVSIDFYNTDILKLANKWGYLSDNPTESQEYKILDNWWNLLAVKTGQLFSGYRIPQHPKG